MRMIPQICSDLTNHFLEIGLYRSAIYSSRQILDLANMDDFQTFSAPLWFNHIRFGYYYPELVNQASSDYGLDPFFIFKPDETGVVL